MNDFMGWVNATKNISSESEKCACPNCGHIGLQVQFVGDSDRMIGHAYVWCGICLHGIHISRVKIPTGAQFLPMNVTEDELLQCVPHYHVVS